MRSVAQDQIFFPSGEINSIPYAHGGFFGAAPFMLANPYWIDVLRSLMPDVYVEISQRVLVAPVPKLIHWAENNPVVAAFGTAHEMEFSGRVSTLEWDVFLDPHLVHRLEVVLEERDKFISRCVASRGGGEGEGEDADGNGSGDGNVSNHPVDKTLLPMHRRTHVEGLLDDPSEKATLQYYNDEISRRTVILVERMLIAHGNLTQLILEQTGYMKKYNFGRIKRTRRTLGGGIFARQWLSLYAEALRMGMGYQDVDGNDISLDVGPSYSDDVDDSSGEFLDIPDLSVDEDDVDQAEEEETPLLSSAMDLGSMQGRTGRIESVPSKYDAVGLAHHPQAFRNRKGTNLRRSASTGSLMNVTKHQVKPNTPLSSPRKKRASPRSATPGHDKPHKSLSALAMSSVPDTTIVESIALLKAITRCNAPLGLVLDIKSRHISHRVWALVVDALRDAGARVEGIASFTVSEIRDISSYCSSQLNEIYFFHSAGDIQQACHRGMLRRGDKVFLNAGSLIWHKRNLWEMNDLWDAMLDFVYFDPETFKREYKLQPHAKIRNVRRCSAGNDSDEVDDESDSYEAGSLLLHMHGDDLTHRGSTIQDYKEYFELSVGLYCQEFAVDDTAIDFIVDHVNDNPEMYALGLSWGGVNGVTVRGIQPDRFTNTDGFWNQRYCGALWDSSLSPSAILDSRVPPSTMS